MLLILKIQAYDSVMDGYFCIGFTDFMLKGKSLTDYNNLSSPNIFKRNDNIIYNLKLFLKWVNAIHLKKAKSKY